MLNKVILIGRLVKDPDLRSTESGKRVVSFMLAVERDYKTDGKRDTDFLTVVAWESAAEFVYKWFAKGMLMIVEGRLHTRKWADRDGVNRTSVEVVADTVKFGESKKARGGIKENQS